MANYLTTDTDLTAVADAIRTKGGTSGLLAFPQGFVDAINDISGGGGIDLSDIAQAVSLDYIGGLFQAFRDGTWGSVEKSFLSGTNPMTVDFGRAIKGVLLYPKSVAFSSLSNAEREVIGIAIYNAEDENGIQSAVWKIYLKKSGGTPTGAYLVNRATTSLENGVLSIAPSYPSNTNYHPFGFGVPYIFVYWW